MKRIVIFLTILGFSGFLASEALAKGVRLSGNAADHFIARYFPNADLPGAVKGAFTYIKHGHKRHGHANCNVPAMGARGDGAVSTCRVVY